MSLYVATGIAHDCIIATKWHSSVIDRNGSVNRISYEPCVLTQLRECIRSKEVWVVGGDRYRNPDDDLPKDFRIGVLRTIPD